MHGDWSYDSGHDTNPQYLLTSSSQGHEFLKLTVTTPGIPPIPPPPPPPPTPPVLHWDFKTFYDNNHAVEFMNPFDIQIVDETYANINRSGHQYYLHAEVPVELLSQRSMSLMLRFKTLAGFHTSINFVFSTYYGPPNHRRGLLCRVVDNDIRFEIDGTNSSSSTNSVNILHIIQEPIIGAPSVLFDDWCQMIVVYDNTNNFIDTYISGVLNSHSVTADVVDVTNYGPGPTVPFMANRWGVEGHGASQWNGFKFFNVALTQSEVTH
jgi:hypothetical protein